MSIPLTLSVDERLRMRLDSAASERGTTAESIVEFALSSFLDDADQLAQPLQGWQVALIEEGLAAADRGDFATSEEVDRVLGKYRS